MIIHCGQDRGSNAGHVLITSSARISPLIVAPSARDRFLSSAIRKFSTIRQIATMHSRRGDVEMALLLCLVGFAAAQEPVSTPLG